jgi:GT2 family glycosyltransferase
LKDTLFFSIVIPTCNRNDLLILCLNCLEPGKQSIDPTLYEVIITDDSKDNKAKSLINEKYPWVQWVEGPKRGPAANRNNGARYSTGKWLVFLDDDCIPDTSILQEYYNAIINNEDILVFEGRILAMGKPRSPLHYAPIKENGGHLWSCNFIIRKDYFFTIKGFDEHFIYPHLEDVDLQERIKKDNNKIFFEKNAFVYHPWRKYSSGVKLGKFQEAYIYYACKHSKVLSKKKFLILILKVHLAGIKRNPISLDFFKALKITFQHFFTVLWYFNKWKRKYSHLRA